VELEKRRLALLPTGSGSGVNANGSPRTGTSPRYGASSRAGGASSQAGAASGRRGSGGAAAAAGVPLPDVDALSKEDREQILASLLAQEHVLNALQRVAFPHRHASGDHAPESAGGTPAQSPPSPLPSPAAAAASGAGAGSGGGAAGGNALAAFRAGAGAASGGRWSSFGDTAGAQAAPPSPGTAARVQGSSGGFVVSTLGSAAGDGSGTMAYTGSRAQQPGSSLSTSAARGGALSRSGWAVATPQPAGAAALVVSGPGAGRPSAALSAVFDTAARSGSATGRRAGNTRV
jgi:hypothetical protein